MKNSSLLISMLTVCASLASACSADVPALDVPAEAMTLGITAGDSDGVATPPAATGANGSTPASVYLFPREASLYGQSYEEWAAAWWRWVLAIPGDVNPNLDGPCDVNQPDHVFFLGGNFGGASTRACTVPKDKAIFFPILNASVSNCPEIAGGSYTCEIAMSEDYIHDTTEFLLDIDNTMTLEIDGVSVEGLDEYRAHTATFFTTAPEEDRVWTCSGTIRENTCGVPVGSPRASASDGHWAMLRPLSPGEHQIRFTASIPSFGFSLDVTYNLTVAP